MGTIERTVIKPTGEYKQKVAFVIHRQEVHESRSELVIEAPKTPLYTPFRDMKEQGREFMLLIPIEVYASSTFASFEELRLSSGSHTDKDLWIDDYYIRKYIETEPEHSNWGGEEVLYP